MIVDIRTLPVSSEWNLRYVDGALEAMEAYIERHRRKAIPGKISIIFIAGGRERTLVQTISPQRVVICRVGRRRRRRKAS